MASAGARRPLMRPRPIRLVFRTNVKVGTVSNRPAPPYPARAPVARRIGAHVSDSARMKRVASAGPPPSASTPASA